MSGIAGRHGRVGRLRRAALPLAGMLAATVLGSAGLAAAADGHSAPSRRATEHIVIMGTAAKSSVDSVIAVGGFTAGGSINLAAGTGKVSAPGGTFRLTPKFGPSKQQFNKTTCLLTISGKGTYTLGHGTGRFAGVTGSGRFVIADRQVNAKAGHRCSTTKAVAFQGTITFNGPVRLP